jgi:transposase
LLDELHGWFHGTLSELSRKSPLALAIRYALTRWKALTRYRDDGHLELENNAAERALRAVALGRKNFLFLGADSGGAGRLSVDVAVDLPVDHDAVRLKKSPSLARTGGP